MINETKTITHSEAENLFNIGLYIGAATARNQITVHDSAAMWNVSMEWSREFERRIDVSDAFVIEAGGYFEAIDSFTNDMLNLSLNRDETGEVIWQVNK